MVALHQSSDWTRLVEGCGGPGITAQYAKGLSESGAKPILVEVRNAGARLVFCAVEREWEGKRDIATGYGLTGAWFSEPDRGLFQAWHNFAAAQGYVAGYLQLAPACAEGLQGVGCVAHNDVYLARLGEGRPSANSRNLRDKIDAALARGAQLSHDPRHLVPALVDLYPTTMARVGAPALFSARTLETWATMPGAVIVGASVGGRIEAVSLFLVHAGVAEYHLNVSTVDGREMTALLLEDAFARLPTLGATTLNLGGGILREDGLAVFKRRFGGRKFPLRSVRQVYDKQVFATLCARAGVSAQCERFPPYRYGNSGSAPVDTPVGQERPDP